MQTLHQPDNIFTVAQYVEQYIEQHWQSVFDDNRAKLEKLFDDYGDGATYGQYGTLLFKPLNQLLKAAGLELSPGLPGNFPISREWGAEDMRQRWFWSKLSKSDGKGLGAIAIIFFHDHTQARIPSIAQVLALTELTDAAIITALSERSSAFAQAGFN